MTENSMTPERVRTALSRLRLPLQTSEYDLHALAEKALSREGIAWEHEVRLGPGCRADLKCGGVVVELKRGKPDRARLLKQLARYAENPEVTGLVLVSERYVDLPSMIGGKPLASLCLNRLWGIAL